MSILNILGIGDAFAEATTTVAPAAGAHSSSSMLSLLPTLILFILVFYFLLIRPQTKRAKEHRKLIEGLAAGDEIVTTGGVSGKVVEIQDNFIIVTVAKGVDMTFQKNAVALVLPKGTIKTV
jgi:preprotein translocase subunit YajC